jgi:hypothetical protein
MHYHTPFKSFGSAIVIVQNPMTHFHSLTLGSSMWNEVKSHTKLGPTPFQNAWDEGKFMNDVGKGIC